MSNFGTSLANAGAPEKRREMDFYPTPPDVTEALMQFLKLPPCLIWEPACGDGAMVNVLRNHEHEVIATDLRNTGFGEGNVNFLKAENRTCDAVITNPPFSHSEEFIRKAVSVAPIVAMVLKSQYWHARKRIKLFSDLPPSYILPLTWRPDFLFDVRVDGKKGSPLMDCIWVIWEAGETDTRYQPLLRPSALKSPQQVLFEVAA